MKVIKPNALPTTLAGFARASTATYVDEAGVLQTAGVNVPRWQGGRLLVEGAATNIATHSQNFGAWSAGGISNMTVITGLQDPTGGLDAARLTSTAANNLFQQAVLVTAGSTLTGSFWIRRHAGVGAVNMRVGDGTAFPIAVSSSWQRVSVTAVASTTTGRLGIVLSVAGDAVEVFGAQLEVGAAMTSYIRTTTAAVTRAADVLTGGGLLYSNATDATAAYVAGTTYAAGAQVAFDRSRYQSLQAANVGHTPDVSPTWWSRLGPLNPWAMFDDQVSTQTAGAAPLRVSFEAGAFDSLAVLAVDAATVTMTVTDGPGGTEVYRRTVGMGAEVVTNWYEYFYTDMDYRRTQVLFTGVPLMGSAVVHLEVQGSGTVRVGHVAWGRMKPVGSLRYGVKAGIRDFSRKETDDFGLTTFVRRANSKTLTAQLEVVKAELNRTQNLLTALSATPVVWVGSDDPSYSDLMVVFGFSRDFYVSVDYPMKAIYSLEIEGLT